MVKTKSFSPGRFLENLQSHLRSFAKLEWGDTEGLNRFFDELVRCDEFEGQFERWLNSVISDGASEASSVMQRLQEYFSRISWITGQVADLPKQKLFCDATVFAQQKAIFLGRFLSIKEEAAHVAESIATLQSYLPLSDVEMNVLHTLELLGAVNADHRKTTEEIAKGMSKPLLDSVILKKPVASLKNKLLIATQEGRGGGCWLTPRGIKRLGD